MFLIGNPQQTAQCAGNRLRQVFGGAQIVRDPFITVAHVAGDEVMLRAGLALSLIT